MPSDNRKHPIPYETWIVFAAGIGSAVGAGVGVAFDQLVFGVAVGLDSGVVISVLIYFVLRVK